MGWKGIKISTIGGAEVGAERSDSWYWMVGGERDDGSGEVWLGGCDFLRGMIRGMGWLEVCD
jgi:hypothetical protein